MPRADQFGDLVVDAVDRIEPRWSPYLRAVDVEIVDVPRPEDAEALGEIPLAAHRAPVGDRPATVIVYRRPVELRARERTARRDLVRDLVAEQLSDLLGLTPNDLDPLYDDRDPDDD